MNSELENYLFEALDSSRTLNELGSSFNRIFDSYGLDVGGEIKKHQLIMDCEGRTVAIGRNARTVTRPNQKRNRTASAGNDYSWEANPLVGGVEREPLRSRKQVGSLIYHWMLSSGEINPDHYQYQENQMGGRDGSNYGGDRNRPSPQMFNNQNYATRHPPEQGYRQEYQQPLAPPHAGLDIGGGTVTDPAVAYQLTIDTLNMGIFSDEQAQKILAYAMERFLDLDAVPEIVRQAQKTKKTSSRRGGGRQRRGTPEQSRRPSRQKRASRQTPQAPTPRRPSVRPRPDPVAVRPRRPQPPPQVSEEFEDEEIDEEFANVFDGSIPVQEGGGDIHWSELEDAEDMDEDE